MLSIEILLFLAGCQTILSQNLTNLALYRPTDQNCITRLQCGTVDAARAVDGNTDPNVFNCHCFFYPFYSSDLIWMAVDLEKMYKIYYVIVYGQEQMNAALDNFFCGLTTFYTGSVQIYQFPLCGQYPGAFPPSRRAVMKCNYNLPPGRYLILQMDPGSLGMEMAVCELEAYELPKQSLNRLIWQKKSEIKLESYVYSTLNIKRGILHCITICISSTKRCDSLNYNQKSGSCELNEHANGYIRSSLVNQSYWYFWSAVNE